MKKWSFWLSSILVMAILIFLSGCSKKSSDNPVSPNNPTTGSGSITMNGDGYNNTKINFGYGVAGYSISDQATMAIFYGSTGNDSLMIVVEFAGQGTGDHAWQEFSDTSSTIIGVGIYVYGSSGSYNYYVPKAGGKTSVSKYGSIGDTIEGSFSGTVKHPVTSNTITISGSFKAMRVPDE